MNWRKPKPLIYLKMAKVQPNKENNEKTLEPCWCYFVCLIFLTRIILCWEYEGRVWVWVCVGCFERNSILFIYFILFFSSTFLFVIFHNTIESLLVSFWCFCNINKIVISIYWSKFPFNMTEILKDFSHFTKLPLVLRLNVVVPFTAVRRNAAFRSK